MQLYYFAISSAPILCATFFFDPSSFTLKIRFIAHSVSQLKVSLAFKRERIRVHVQRGSAREERNEGGKRVRCALLKMRKDDCFISCSIEVRLSCVERVQRLVVGDSIAYRAQCDFWVIFDGSLNSLQLIKKQRKKERKNRQCNYCTCRSEAEVNLCPVQLPAAMAHTQFNFPAMKRRTKSVKMLLLPIELLAVGTPFNSFVTRQFEKKKIILPIEAATTTTMKK